ncbi:MAG: CrcB family protein [Pseudomonadota bacterium]
MSASSTAPLTLTTFVAVAMGGATGACLRYVIVSVSQGTTTALPIGTMVVNVIGCLVAGLLLPVVGGHSVAQAALIVGFCGGFTTMSAFSVDLLSLIGAGQFNKAVLYFAATLLVSMLALVVGVETSRWMQRW